MRKILERAKEIKQIELEQIETTKNLDLLYVNETSIELRISAIEEEISESKKNQKNTFINNVMKTIHIGKDYKLQQEIEEKIKDMEKLKIELNSVQIKIKQLQEKNSKFLEILNASDIQKYFKFQDGEIIITDWENKFILKKSLDSYESSKIDDSNKVLIHSTNFFPKNQTILSNYDGGKILKKKLNYRGLEKDVSFLSHRHEVHFTINARVQNTGAGEGNWDDSHYMIIDRLDTHKDEMESLNASDSWTKGTSLKLSNAAIIMVRIQDKGKLPISDEDLSQYNIVYYDGDPTKCLENFLQINGYNVFKIDPNNAGHYWSTRATQEFVTEMRDRVINFYQDNTYDGKENIILSEADILMILDIAISTDNIPSSILNENKIKEILKDKVSSVKNLNLFQAITKFLVGAGIKIANNGMYTFKSDEEILEDLEKLENTPDKLREIIDEELIYMFYKKYEELKKVLDNMSTDQIRSLIDKNFEYQLETIEEEIIRKNK